MPTVTPDAIKRRTPEYVAYRGIINLDNLLDLFGPDYEAIVSIYDDLKHFYGDDFLFWLQFGRAELYFDHFVEAENYLNQSLGIRDGHNFQARHHMGVLLLKRALFEENSAAANISANQGEEILRRQILERGGVDSYAYSALVTHKLRYLGRWKPDNLPEQIESLFRLSEEGMRKHPSEEAMREAHMEIYRAYLMTAVKPGREADST